MNAEEIWRSFRSKILHGMITSEDITHEMQEILLPFFSNTHPGSLIPKMVDAPASFYNREKTASVLLHIGGEPVRLDFVEEDSCPRLAFIECITIPMTEDIPLPYS